MDREDGERRSKQSALEGEGSLELKKAAQILVACKRKKAMIQEFQGFTKKLGLGSEGVSEDLWSVAFRKVVETELVSFALLSLAKLRHY